MGWVNFPWECLRLTHKACTKQLDRGLDSKYWDNLLFSWLFFTPYCHWVGIPSSGVSFATASLITDGIRFWFFVSRSVEEGNKIYLRYWTTWRIFVFQLKDAVKRKWKCESLSRVLPSATPWTVARQAPLSMEFSRQEILEWGCHFLLQGIFPTQGSNLNSQHLLQWQADSSPLSQLGSPRMYVCVTSPPYMYIYDFPTDLSSKQSACNTAISELQVRSLGLEHPLEEQIATQSSILAWRIPMDRGAWRAPYYQNIIYDSKCLQY